MNVRSIVRLAGLSVALCVSTAALAQSDFPSKPIRVLVPYPAGGAVDVIARVLGPSLNASFKQPIIVDNKPGASGILATEALLKAPPDGHTIIIVISSHSVNPSLYKKLPYDTLQDFAPVTLIGTGPNILSVNPSLPAHSVNDLIALAKARPGKINYASFGTGSSSHLSGELFNLMAGVKLVAVPYKGAGPAVTDVLGGHVSLMFGNMPVSLPQVRSGQLRALAVTGAKRSPAAPELPTISESGLSGYETGEWWGVLVHSKTPKSLVQRWNREIVAALRDPTVKERLSDLGADISADSPEAFGQFIKQQLGKWGDVIRRAQIEPF
jgi:tripartite-type tricarboxylate transporter receptor subunit TctC